MFNFYTQLPNSPYIHKVFKQIENKTSVKWHNGDNPTVFKERYLYELKTETHWELYIYLEERKDKSLGIVCSIESEIPPILNKVSNRRFIDELKHLYPKGK